MPEKEATSKGQQWSWAKETQKAVEEPSEELLPTNHHGRWAGHEGEWKTPRIPIKFISYSSNEDEELIEWPSDRRTTKKNFEKLKRLQRLATQVIVKEKASSQSGCKYQKHQEEWKSIGRTRTLRIIGKWQNPEKSQRSRKHSKSHRNKGQLIWIDHSCKCPRLRTIRKLETEQEQRKPSKNCNRTVVASDDRPRSENRQT